MAQKAKIIATVALFVITVASSLVLLALASKQGNDSLILAAVGVKLLFAAIASTLIMSYLNTDLKARGLRWKYQ